jgi:DNA adenine methylase
MIEAPDRPVLRWHGGKWMLGQWIISHFPAHRFYTEAYGGAASVLLQKPRCEAEIYNDLDADVVNLFRVLRNDREAARLVRSLRLTPFARDEFELTYQETPASRVERARRFIARSYMGFGSSACTEPWRTGFRVGGLVSGTHAFRDWIGYPDSLLRVIDRLRGVVVENLPALEILQKHDTPDTLHYVDPPYLHSTRKKWQQRNYRHEMTEADHRELAAVANSLRGGVIVSGYASRLYDEELYPKWHRSTRTALADGARPRVEVLWINDAAMRRDDMLL